MSRVLATTATGVPSETTVHARTPIDTGNPAGLTRRLDWRFLLPDSHLGRVAYIGAGEGLLLPALQVFAESLRRPFEYPMANESVELLVAQGVAPSQLRAAMSRLAPGGVVYWEINPIRRLFASDWTGLHRLGLEPIDTFWHYPDFERCELIIPLSTPAPLAWLARRKFSTTDRRTLLRVVRWFAGAPGLWRVLPSISVVARRPEVAKTSW